MTMQIISALTLLVKLCSRLTRWMVINIIQVCYLMNEWNEAQFKSHFSNLKCTRLIKPNINILLVYKYLFFM